MTQFPLPDYALNDKVRYKPYHRHDEWPTPFHPQPWRIIGIEVTVKLRHQDVMQYFIEPWVIAGEWFVHRPMKIFEDQLTAWPEEESVDA